MAVNGWSANAKVISSMTGPLRKILTLSLLWMAPLQWINVLDCLFVLSSCYTVRHHLTCYLIHFLIFMSYWVNSEIRVNW